MDNMRGRRFQGARGDVTSNCPLFLLHSEPQLIIKPDLEYPLRGVTFPNAHVASVTSFYPLLKVFKGGDALMEKFEQLKDL